MQNLLVMKLDCQFLYPNSLTACTSLQAELWTNTTWNQVGYNFGAGAAED